MQELRQKLRRRFPDEQLVESELQCLAAENLQSDVRFAEAFAIQRASRGYGFKRVRQELRERGLTESQVGRAIESAAIDWPAAALEVFRKKFGEGAPADLKDKAKRIRFMEYRGFDRDHYQCLLSNQANSD
jgi:regulatory protein